MMPWAAPAIDTPADARHNARKKSETVQD